MASNLPKIEQLKHFYPTKEGKQYFVNIVLYDGTYYKFKVEESQNDRYVREYFRCS